MGGGQTKGKHSYYGWLINEPFYAFNKKSGNVIEVIGGKNLSERKFERNKELQQFYFDHVSSTIKSVSYKNLSWHIQDDGKSRNMQLHNTNGRWFQMFRLEGDRIYNERRQQVGVANGDNVVIENRSNRMEARWDIKYVKDEQFYKDGEYHSRYGFYCGRKFYIASKRDGRYL